MKKVIAREPGGRHNNVINYDDASKPVGQHFLQSSKARTLSAKAVARMAEEDAYRTFLQLRWPDTGGEAVCPYCDYDRCYEIRTRRVFKCAACRKTFTVTSGTLFHSHKLEYRDYLYVIALFINAAKGISALQIARDAGISHKAAFVLLHKLRLAVEDGRKDMRLGGFVEIDGAYYGGHHRPPNAGRQGARKTERREKQCVLTMVGRGGGTIPVVVRSENTDSVLGAVARYIQSDAVLYADEHGSYDVLHAHHEIHRINHRWEYSRDGHICTNQAESFHSRMRRAEIGQYHHISGKYLGKYASEAAYRSDRRRVDNGAVFAEVMEMTITHPISREWKGYWQKRA